MLLLDELRSGTHDQHQRLHQVVDLQLMVATKSRYLAALTAYARVIPNLEAQLSAFGVGSSLGGFAQDLQSRLCKTGWLQKDIAFLSVDLHGDDFRPLVVEEVTLALPATIEAVVGCSYVMEGMTLGATRIAPIVNKALQIGPDNGGRFFHAYGDDTNSKWQAYRSWVASLEIDHQATVAVAQQTFETFETSLTDWPANRSEVKSNA